MKLLASSTVLAVLLTMQPICLLAQSQSVEQQVKAAFLLNFAKFIEWPAEVFSDGTTPFTFCVVGDGFHNVLQATIQGETLNGRPLTVRPGTSAENLRACQIVFLGDSERQRIASILLSLKNSPVLTVGETADFITNGGIVRFTKSGNRVRFEINPDAAQRASLRVSSRLLRVADVVRHQGALR